MNKIEGIPDGWELVRIGQGKTGDYRLGGDGVIMECASEWSNTNNVIIRQVDNSKLIAAAHELLDACKLALKDLDAWGIHGPGRKAIEAAIEKAIGELD